MLFERKTKDREVWKYLIFPISLFIVFITSFVIFGPEIAFMIIGTVYFIISIYHIASFIKTKNAGFIALTSFMLSVTLVCFSMPATINNKNNSDFTIIFLIVLYVSMLITGYLTFNRKIKWRGLDIFELAAMDIEDTKNNFTARPRPSGKVEISKTEMIRFKKFISSRLIAFIYPEEKRILFVLPLPGYDFKHIFGLKIDFDKETWISIDHEGNISTQITQEDYLIYKKDYDFDQISQSLGDLFVEFIELSKAGEESKIIEKMDALRLNPFS